MVHVAEIRALTMGSLVCHGSAFVILPIRLIACSSERWPFQSPVQIRLPSQMKTGRDTGRTSETLNCRFVGRDEKREIIAFAISVTSG